MRHAASFFPDRIHHARRQDPRYRAEVEFFDALARSLPRGWNVFYHVGWFNRDGRGELRDGEADFVLAHERHGVLVVELKGGFITYDGRRRQWVSTDRRGLDHDIDDPFAQAVRSKHTLIDKVRETPGWGDKWVAVHHAVAFVDCDRREGRITADADPAPICRRGDPQRAGGVPEVPPRPYGESEGVRRRGTGTGAVPVAAGERDRRRTRGGLRRSPAGSCEAVYEDEGKVVTLPWRAAFESLLGDWRRGLLYVCHDTNNRSNLPGPGGMPDDFARIDLDENVRNTTAGYARLVPYYRGDVGVRPRMSVGRAIEHVAFAAGGLAVVLGKVLNRLIVSRVKGRTECGRTSPTSRGWSGPSSPNSTTAYFRTRVVATPRVTPRSPGRGPCCSSYIPRLPDGGAASPEPGVLPYVAAARADCPEF